MTQPYVPNLERFKAKNGLRFSKCQNSRETLTGGHAQWRSDQCHPFDARATLAPAEVAATQFAAENIARDARPTARCVLDYLKNSAPNAQICIRPLSISERFVATVNCSVNKDAHVAGPASSIFRQWVGKRVTHRIIPKIRTILTVLRTLSVERQLECRCAGTEWPVWWAGRGAPRSETHHQQGWMTAPAFSMTTTAKLSAIWYVTFTGHFGTPLAVSNTKTLLFFHFMHIYCMQYFLRDDDETDKYKMLSKFYFDPSELLST